MLFDLVALGLLLLFAVLGAARGALASGLGLATLVIAYTAGALAALRSGPELATLLGWPPWLGAATAGSAAFATAFLILALVGLWVRRWDRERAADGRTALDRIGGALFGATRGALVVLLVGVLALWVDAFQTFSQGRESAAAGSPLRLVTQRAVQAGAEAALADAGPGGDFAARVLARPTETLTDLRALVEHPHVAQLAADRGFWIHVERGALDAALTRWSYRRLAGDAALRGDLARLGLVGDSAASDAAIFDREARLVLGEVGPRLRSLREDPELQQLGADPQVAEWIQSGNYIALLRHPGFQRVVSRALETDS